MAVMGRLIIDGNSVYEIDEECMRRKEESSGFGENGWVEDQAVEEELSTLTLAEKKR